MDNINETQIIKELNDEIKNEKMQFDDGYLVPENNQQEIDSIKYDEIIESEDVEFSESGFESEEFESEELGLDLRFGEEEQINKEIEKKIDADVMLEEMGDFEITEEDKLEKTRALFDSLRCERKISVYAKLNREGYITELASDIFLKDFSGWIKIDEGDGDKYVHPQMCYFEDGLTDEHGRYKHKASQ